MELLQQFHSLKMKRGMPDYSWTLTLMLALLKNWFEVWRKILVKCFPNDNYIASRCLQNYSLGFCEIQKDNTLQGAAWSFVELLRYMHMHTWQQFREKYVFWKQKKYAMKALTLFRRLLGQYNRNSLCFPGQSGCSNKKRRRKMRKIHPRTLPFNCKLFFLSA